MCQEYDRESVYLSADDAQVQQQQAPVSASPELLQRALKKIRPDSPDVTRAAKRLERAKKTLVKIRQKEIVKTNLLILSVYLYLSLYICSLYLSPSVYFYLSLSICSLYLSPSIYFYLSLSICFSLPWFPVYIHMSFCLPQLVTVFLSPSTSLCLSVNDFLSVASFLCPSGSVCLTPSTSLCLFVSVSHYLTLTISLWQVTFLFTVRVYVTAYDHFPLYPATGYLPTVYLKPLRTLV